MAKPIGGVPNSGISKNYPVGKPNPRVNTPTGQPAVHSPGVSPYSKFKAGLPKLPAATQLFHSPRKAGNG